MRTHVLAAVLTAGLVLGLMPAVASATPVEPVESIIHFNGPGNPAAPSFGQSLLAPTLALNYGMNNHSGIHAAAAPAEDEPQPAPASGWFEDPVGFFEYHYASNRDRRTQGLDMDLNGGTLGVVFRSVEDVTVGLMYDYTSGSGAGTPNIDATSDSNTFTFFLSKNVGKFYFGSSFSFGDTSMRTRQAGVRVRTEVDSYVVAPYVGLAAYQQGPFSAYSTLTMVWRWQDFQYTRGTPNDDSSDGTLVLMNRLNYAMSEQCILTGIFDWNRVLQEEFTNTDPLEDPDHCWFTIGAKVRVFLTEKLEVYAQCTGDIGNESYENVGVTLGASLAF